MNRRMAMAGVLTGVMLSIAPMGAQSGVTGQLAELVALKDKVGNADTRVRVDALHRVWSVALASGDSEVKVTAIGLLTEPVGSSSDHIRMPAVYAVADIANSAGGTDTVVNSGLVSRTQLRRFKHSANSVNAAGDEARHGVEPRTPPADPMTIAEARSLVDILLSRWLANGAV